MKKTVHRSVTLDEDQTDKLLDGELVRIKLKLKCQPTDERGGLLTNMNRLLSKKLLSEGNVFYPNVIIRIKEKWGYQGEKFK